MPRNAMTGGQFRHGMGHDPGGDPADLDLEGLWWGFLYVGDLTVAGAQRQATDERGHSW